MYPQANLDLLAQRKRALLGNIQARREACSEQLQAVLQPVMWIESMYARWKAISPAVKLAAVPVGVVLKQRLFPGGGLIGKVLQWGPVALNLFRSKR